MRKFIYSTFSVAALLLTASCAKEINEENGRTEVPAGMVEVSFGINYDDSAVKSSLGPDLTVIWTDGEEVAIYDGISSSPNKFTVSDASETGATITGTVSEGTTTVMAVYPFSAAKARTDNSLSVSIPNPQIIPAEGTVAPNALVSVATGELEGKLTFRNATSLMKFNLGSHNDVEAILVSSNSSTGFIGTTTVEFDKDGLPSLSAAATNRVRITCEDGECFKPETDYYMAIAPVTFEAGFTVCTTIKDGDSKYIKTKSSSVSFERNGGKDLGNIVGTRTLPMVIKTKADLDAWATNTKYYLKTDVVKLGNNINYEGGNWTPVKGYTGAFDGQNYSIYNFSIKQSDLDNVAFFESLDYSNHISNLKLGYDPESLQGSTTPIALSTSESVKNVAGLVGKISGSTKSAPVVISNVHNYIQAKVQSKVDATSTPNIAGLVGSTTTPVRIENCSNNAVVANISSGVLKGGYLGGIIGLIKSNDCEISNCVNNGKIEGGNGATSSSNVFAGGIVGRSASGTTSISIQNCSNTAQVGVSKNIKNQVICGGIIGADNASANKNDFDMVIEGCNNSGIVLLNSQSSNVYCGGIIGFAKSHIKIADCGNTASFTKADKVNNNTWGYYGGIAGNTDTVEGSIIENCTNSGAISSASQTGGSSKFLHGYGGITGICSIDIKDCTTSGNISINCSNAFIQEYAGGIAGIYAKGNVSGSKNTGNINDASTTTAATHGAGGLFGMMKDVEFSSADGCSVNATVSSTTNAGMIVGYFEGYTAAKTFGTTGNKVKVAGSLNSTVLDAYNYASKLGPTNNATYNTEYGE